MIDDLGAWLILDLIERRIAPWGYDIVARLEGRMLIARGGIPPGGGGGRRRRGSDGRGPRIPAQLRQSRRTTDARVRLAQRAAEISREQEAYAKRFYRRASAIRRTAVANLKQAEKDLAASEKQRKAELRILGHFLTPAQQRSRYQRRVVAGIRGQLGRGEVPSIRRAIGTRRATVRAQQPAEITAPVRDLTDSEASELIIQRLRQVFPNSENYPNSFADLRYLPETARALLLVPEEDLYDLIVDMERGKDSSTGSRFVDKLNGKLNGLMVVQERQALNPMWYHSSNHTDYGI